MEFGLSLFILGLPSGLSRSSITTGLGMWKGSAIPRRRFIRFPCLRCRGCIRARTLFQPSVWVGWLKGAMFKHGIGAIKEDGHQMQGIFFLKGRKIVREFRYRTIADEPNYLKLVA